MKESCENCRFFVNKPDGGECHRHAPRPAMSGQMDESLAQNVWWPHVASTDFCGEFVAVNRESRTCESGS